jgi:tRNA pseudouridine55 synthase
MDGILNVLKPSGPTSFSIVSGVKRITREARVGHGGTLDPLASGVLPVFLGQATRLSQYLMEHSKTYRAEIELGTCTDSYDAEGNITATADYSSVTQCKIAEALEGFKGEISQTPPVYSAIKRGGQPLYKLARQGLNVEIDSRPANIYRLEIISFRLPVLTLDVECSKGTYIRSLAHDLGKALGCGAHLKGLTRTSYGPFNIKDAVTPERIESAVLNGTICELVLPMDSVLSSWSRIALTPEQLELLRCGRDLNLNVDGGVARLRAYDEQSNLVALLEYKEDAGLWHPQKGFYRG